MSKQLPPRPSLDHLRDQAKSLLSDYKRGDPTATERFLAYLPGFFGGPMALHDAQSVVAREYGQPSWPKLVAHVEELRATEGITPEIEKAFLDFITSSSAKQAARLLELYPGLPRFSPCCALVCAEVDMVKDIDPRQKLGPQQLTPIEYVAYSCICALLPDRYQALEDCARDLLGRGADPNSYVLWGEEQSHIPVLYGAAAESKHIGIVRLLLEHGADPNDDEAVYHSAERGFIESLAVLEEFGADLKRPGHLGYLVHHHRFTPEMVVGTRWLVEHGGDPNFHRTEREDTPLHNVCRFSQDTELIGILLDHGANPATRNAEGDTPYLVAYVSGNLAVVQYLESRGIKDEPSSENALFAACAANDAVSIQQALQGHPDAVTKLAARAGEQMRQFGEQGNAQGLLGFVTAGFPVEGDLDATPLHFACIQGHLEAAQVLVEHGSALDKIDHWHNASPLQWAVYGSKFMPRPGGQYAEIAALLVRAGSSIEQAQAQLDDADLPEEITASIREALASRST